MRVKGEIGLLWMIGILALAALFVLLCYFVYKIAFFNDLPLDDPYDIPDTIQYRACEETIRLAIDAMLKAPYERVTVESFDGLRLSARYYHTADNAPVQIQMHGYRGNALRDMCGGFALARKLGQNVLVVDQRAHGQSEGSVITFGVKERRDCLTWIRYANARFGANTPIILTGVSMGAATVLMALDLQLPDNVAGVIADCPFSHPMDIIQKVAHDMKLPGPPVRLFASAAARIFAGFSLRESSAREAVKKAKIPVLLIHGDDDRFVPCDMSSQILSANPQMITLETFPGAGHGLSYMVDQERYESSVQAFIEKSLV